MGKESACNVGNLGDIGLRPVLGRSPGKGNGTPLQYSCLKNPMDRGVWQTTVQRAAKSQTWLSNEAHDGIYIYIYIHTHIQNRLPIYIDNIYIWFSPGGSMVKNPPAKEMWVWSLGQEDPLEKEMATHSSILAWEIPSTEEPGGLQSTGWQKS